MPKTTSISRAFSVEKLDEAMEEASEDGEARAVAVEAGRCQVKGAGVSAMMKKSGCETRWRRPRRAR